MKCKDKRQKRSYKFVRPLFFMLDYGLATKYPKNIFFVFEKAIVLNIDFNFSVLV